MESVMINQLPELAIPRYRNIGMMKATTVPEKRNPYITKWYVLFDNKNDQWISFQPQIGHVVYPCYACRDMFGSRDSFLDHVNRRGLVCKYKCSICKMLKTFYNTCSFLLHCRDHFSDTSGEIDLDNIEITTIPMDIAGFLPIPNVTRLYDSEDDTINTSLKLNVKFYKPTDDCVGKRYVSFVPNDLIFFCSVSNNLRKETEAMILKQVNRSIPKCLFVPILSSTNNNNSSDTVDNIVISEDESDVICLDDDDSHLTSDDVTIKPKIQVKNLSSLMNINSFSSSSEDEPDLLPNCPECKVQQRIMLEHFQEISQPIADNYKCKTCGLISTSDCALKAHIRIHDRKYPFVCPECGNDFDSWEELDEHMENICFHTVKTVRYKCPAKKCGKVFAQNVTFSSHFPVAHMKVRFMCKSCPSYFSSEIEFAQHRHKNEPVDLKNYTRIHECTVCSTPTKDIKKHVLDHVNDKDNRIFVFICRYCRSCYRSKQTYATHIVKCTKLLLNNLVKKEVQRSESQSDIKCKVIKFCKPCNRKIQINCTYQQIKNLSNKCTSCLLPFSNEVTIKNKYVPDYEYTSHNFVSKNLENNTLFCNLCSTTLENGDEDNINYDLHFCKYKNPVVVLESHQSHLNSRVIEHLDLLEERQVSPNSDDSSKRKRKRLFFGAFKNKRNSSEKVTEEDLTADPEPFDGEYKCKCCEFRSESRKAFHDHIQQHRDISTSYQCMECGECFVVKPSLIKHLQVFHLVENIDDYMAQNECFDKEAVRMLEENMRMVPGEVKEPVAENQCRICRQFFPDAQKLSKHFRVHGMAFLMKKIIK